ncbi:hypothetical protein Dimus_037123, partial [Dionaea muscipula]
DANELISLVDARMNSRMMNCIGMRLREDDDDGIADETDEDINSEADEDDTDDVETIVSYDSDV